MFILKIPNHSATMLYHCDASFALKPVQHVSQIGSKLELQCFRALELALVSSITEEQQSIKHLSAPFNPQCIITERKVCFLFII